MIRRPRSTHAAPNITRRRNERIGDRPLRALAFPYKALHLSNNHSGLRQEEGLVHFGSTGGDALTPLRRDRADQGSEYPAMQRQAPHRKGRSPVIFKLATTRPSTSARVGSWTAIAPAAGVRGRRGSGCSSLEVDDNPTRWRPRSSAAGQAPQWPVTGRGARGPQVNSATRRGPGLLSSPGCPRSAGVAARPGRPVGAWLGPTVSEATIGHRFGLQAATGGANGSVIVAEIGFDARRVLSGLRG